MQIKIQDIIIPANRKRPLNNNAVSKLMESIETLGLLTPILVNHNNDKYELISGLHRLEAFKLLNRGEIEARIVTFDDLKKELAEIDENLIRNELNVLERANHLLRRKQLYVKIYPDTQSVNVIGGPGRGHKTTAESAVVLPTFTKDTTEKTGIAERTIRENIQIANKIIPEVKEKIKTTPLANSKVNLLTLARQTPEVQEKAVERILNGEAADVREAVVDISREKKYEDNKIFSVDGSRIYNKSCLKMDDVKSESIHLIVTSPPYNVGKEYEEKIEEATYWKCIRTAMMECKRVLVDGGRICVNVANIGRSPYLPYNVKLCEIMMDLGFKMRGEIIWDKGASASGACAWGSWLSHSNPSLRDQHEYIQIYSKENYKLNSGSDTITREEFLEYTRSIWRINPESAKKVNHPAPFPVDIPLRLIKLYTGSGDVVLDPFMGSGSTLVAAKKAGRLGIGYELKAEYCDLAITRIEKTNTELNTFNLN